MKVAAAMLCGVLAMSASAQTAKVVELDSAEAAKIRALYEERDKVAHEIIATEQAIAIKHNIGIQYPTRASGCIVPPGAVSCTPSALPAPVPGDVDDGFAYKEGWTAGIEYSEDFRFIVPKRITAVPSGPVWATQLTQAPISGVTN